MTTHRVPRRPSLESLVQRVDAHRPGEIPGDTVPTGFPSIDKLLGGGLRRRDLIVLGGDVGRGQVVARPGHSRCASPSRTSASSLLSGEMDEERLMERALALEGRVSVDELRAAELSDQMRAGIGAAAVRLRGLPLSLLPLAAQDLETALARLDGLKRVALIVLDYLQLVPPPAGTTRGAQDEEMAAILRHLKAAGARAAGGVAGRLTAAALRHRP